MINRSPLAEVVTSDRRERSRSPLRKRHPSRGDDAGRRPSPFARDPRNRRVSDVHLFEERGSEVSPIDTSRNRNDNHRENYMGDNYVQTASHVGRPSSDKPLYRFREDIVTSNSPSPPPVPPLVTLFPKDSSATSHPDSSTNDAKEQLVDVELDLLRWIHANDPSCSAGDVLRVKAYKFAKGRDLDVDVSYFSEEWFKTFKMRHLEGASSSESGEIKDQSSQESSSSVAKKSQSSDALSDNVAVSEAVKKIESSDSGVAVDNSSKKDN